MKVDGGWRAAWLALLAVVLLTGCRTNRLPEYKERLQTAQLVTQATGRPLISLNGLMAGQPPGGGMPMVLGLGVSAELYERLLAASTPETLVAHMTEVLYDKLEAEAKLRPVGPRNPADARLEVEVQDYGLVASNITDGIYFMLQVEARLTHLDDGELIWEYGQTRTYPLRVARFHGGMATSRQISAMVTFSQLQALDEEELREVFVIMVEEATDDLLAQMIEDRQEAP